MKKRIGVVAILLVALALSACATAPYTGRSQYITMSADEEIKHGLAASGKILSSEPIERDTARAARVAQIGQRIARVAEQPELPWAFYVIAGPEVNAFALPGGKVFVYTGLIEFVDDRDNELAVVIGHEIAHIMARHAAERVSQQRTVSIGGALLGIVVGVASAAATGDFKLGQDVQNVFYSLADIGILLPYSRIQETEADHIGAILMAKAGYDPRASVTLWKKMAAENTGGRRRIALLSTHPLDETRIADLERMMPEALTYYRSDEK